MSNSNTTLTANAFINAVALAPDWDESSGGIKSIILASESEDCWGPYDSWSDFAGKVNWCLTNCVGPWRIAPLTAERTTYHNVGSVDHHDEVQPPVFAFDLDDDAVLFKLKFGGAQ